jgi:C-terminal processing protease CtpA/Prc
MQYIEEKILPYVDVKSPYAVERTIAYLLQSTEVFPDTLSLTVQTPDKKIITYDLISVNLAVSDYDYVVIRERFPNGWKPMNLSWLENNIAILTINTFNQSSAYSALLDSLLEEASTAKKLIIDIRNNGGGSTDMSYSILKRLCKQKAFLSLAAQTRINSGAGKANGNWMEEYEDFYLMKAYQTDSAEWIEVESDIKRYEMPVVILVSERTASAAEDFLVMLYEWKERPVIIGRPTLGSTGSPLVIPLPEDGYARVCTRRCLFPYSMKPFSYIQPDIEVIYTLEEYASGRDKDIEKALEILHKR